MTAFALTAMALSPLVVAPGVAQASGQTTWHRSCGTTYYGTSQRGSASTTKINGGSCAGHAWVKGRIGADSWLSWAHGTSFISQYDNRIIGARHKGCEDCEIHTT